MPITLIFHSLIITIHCAHANLIDNAFYKFPALEQFVVNQIRDVGELQVCSFGGGPGSELLGFVKFIERRRQNTSPIWLNFALIDKVCAWDESWQKLIDGLKSTFREHYDSREQWPVAIERSFLSLDLTRIQDFQQFPVRFKDIQIYVLNYVISEIMSYAETFTLVLAHIVKLASEGAFFLFIDRNQREVVSVIRQIITSTGLRCIGTAMEQSFMDRDEQKADLGRWYHLFDRSPKVTWDAFFALAQKGELPSDDLPF
jgi:hypothetical protein